MRETMILRVMHLRKNDCHDFISNSNHPQPPAAPNTAEARLQARALVCLLRSGEGISMLEFRYLIL
jgi:hypothetical protein